MEPPLISTFDLSGLERNSVEASFAFCWGLDGSGDHKDYNQLSKCDYSTKQVMSICFAVKNIKVTDRKGMQVDWKNAVTGANKPQQTRPLGLFPEKECTALLEELVPKLEIEVKKLQDEGLLIGTATEIPIRAKCNEAKLSMADGKMVTSLLNLGGAFCTMCTRDQNDCQNPEIIEEGFLIDRSIESIRDLALSLVDPDSGEIVKKKGDYKTRTGVCGVPITTSDITKHIPVCHSKIRVFEFIMDLVARTLSHKKWWTPGRKVKYTDEDKELYKTAREYLKQAMKQNLGINIGNPGDMVTGAAFQAFSSDFARDFLCGLLEVSERDRFREILLGLCTLVKIINSQKRKIDTDKVRRLGKLVNIQLVQCFPWIAISPSVHRIIAHSWEVILLNNSFGLGDQSEEVLEALNKQEH